MIGEVRARPMQNYNWDQLISVMKARHSVRAYTTELPSRKLIYEILETAIYAPNSCNLQHYGFIYIDDEDLLKKLRKIATGKISWAPALIVAINDQRFSKKRRAGLQSLSASIENIILAATAKGLGTCWMAGFKNDSEIKKILGVPNYYEITALITIGFPDQRIKHYPVVKLKVSEFIHINKYERKNTELIQDIDVDYWDMTKLISYRDRIGSVYAQRGRIGLYNRSMVNEAVNIFTYLAAPVFKSELNESVCILDAISYDGMFLRELSRRKCVHNHELTACDYSPYFLSILKSHIPEIDTIKIAENHKIVSEHNKRYKIISLVFKIEHLPKPEKLLAELKKIADRDGYLFLASISAEMPRAIGYWFDRIIHFGGNVYEKNRLYKLGPYRHRSKAAIENIIQKAGWTVVRKGSAGSGLMSRFRWWWLESANKYLDG